MTEKKKMGAGLVLSVITALVTVAGLVLYMMNCKTNYFINSGVDNAIVACLAVAAILEIVMIAASVKMGAKPVLDIIPVVCGVLTAYALIQFISSRIAAMKMINRDLTTPFPNFSISSHLFLLYILQLAEHPVTGVCSL